MFLPLHVYLGVMEQTGGIREQEGSQRPGGDGSCRYKQPKQNKVNFRIQPGGFKLRI